MADVFISYQRKDREICTRIALALQRNFFSVWWDEHVHARESWDRIKDQELYDQLVRALESNGSYADGCSGAILLKNSVLASSSNFACPLSRVGPPRRGGIARHTTNLALAARRAAQLASGGLALAK